MAKAFVILLAFLYAFSATGATVHLHYCCGKLQHLAMQDEKATGDDNCSLCLKHHESNKHACDDDLSCDTNPKSHNHCQDIKVDAPKTTGEHLPGGDKNVTKIQSLALLVFTLVHFADLSLDSQHTNQTVDAPPLKGATPLFIQYCTYRI